eukprot:10343086-Lingulodinium_polyedra.AAC.1
MAKKRGPASERGRLSRSMSRARESSPLKTGRNSLFLRCEQTASLAEQRSQWPARADRVIARR